MVLFIRFLGTIFFGIIGLVFVSFAFAGSAPPLNDNVADSQELVRVPGLGGGLLEEYALSDNTGATAEPNEPDHHVYQPQKSVWFKWTADTIFPVTVYTTGSQFDTILDVFDVVGLQNKTAITSDDDTDGYASLIKFTPVYGKVYYFCVDGVGGATGKIYLRLSRAENFITGILSLPLSYTAPEPAPFILSTVQDDKMLQDFIYIWFDNVVHVTSQNFRIPLHRGGVKLYADCQFCNTGTYLTSFYHSTGAKYYLSEAGSFDTLNSSTGVDFFMLQPGYSISGSLTLPDGKQAAVEIGFELTARNTAKSSFDVFFASGSIAQGQNKGLYTMYLPPGTVSDFYWLRFDCSASTPAGCRKYKFPFYAGSQWDPLFKYVLALQKSEAYLFAGNAGSDVGVDLELLPASHLSFPVKAKDGQVLIISF